MAATSTLAGIGYDHRIAPLAGVRLSITRTNLAITTDADGKFAFEADVPPGKLDLFTDSRNVTNRNNQQYPSLHFESRGKDFPNISPRRNECLNNAVKVYLGLFIGGAAAHEIRQKEMCVACK